MNDEKTVEVVHEELLGGIDDKYQKTEGFPVWDILKAAALGLYKLWEKVFDIEAKQNVDNLTGEELERFVFQRKGVTRKEATPAVGVVKVKGNGIVYAGDLFSTEGGVIFAADQDIPVDGEVLLHVTCTTPGAIGNVPVDTIKQFPVTLPGIIEVTNPYVMVDGYDAETDDSLRERYYEALQKPATSGNIYHYERWAREVAGVGEVKVFPLWQGDNTVQVVIIDDQKLVPAQELVDRVQEYIDPNKAGTGMGQAPIGAYCTVSPAEKLDIVVEAILVLTPTGNIELIHDEVEKLVTAYLKEVAFESNYVSLAKIGDLILQVSGVEDYDSLTVNGNINRVQIPAKSVAILKEVVVSAL